MSFIYCLRYLQYRRALFVKVMNKFVCALFFQSFHSMAQRNNMTRFIRLKCLSYRNFDFWRCHRIGSNISDCQQAIHKTITDTERSFTLNVLIRDFFEGNNLANWDDSCREYRHLVLENKIMSVVEMLFERKSFFFPTSYILCHVSLNFLLLCFSIRQMKSPTNVTLHGGQCKFHYSLALFSSILSIFPLLTHFVSSPSRRISISDG